MRHVLNAKWHPFSVSPILTPNALRPSEVLPSRRLTPELSRSRIEVLPPSYARRHPSFRSTNMVRTTQMVCTIAEAEAIVKAATPLGLSAACDRGRPDARALPTCTSKPCHAGRSSWTDCIGGQSLPVEELSPPGWWPTLFKGHPVAAEGASVWRRITVPPLGAGMPARAADD
jgi:hypothetical protein